MPMKVVCTDNYMVSYLTVFICQDDVEDYSLDIM